MGSSRRYNEESVEQEKRDKKKSHRHHHPSSASTSRKSDSSRRKRHHSPSPEQSYSSEYDVKKSRSERDEFKRRDDRRRDDDRYESRHQREESWSREDERGSREQTGKRRYANESPELPEIEDSVIKDEPVMISTQPRHKKIRRVVGETDESAEDWIERSRRIQQDKIKAERIAKMLDEADKEFSIDSLIQEEARKSKANSYTSKDIHGMRVVHSEKHIKEGQQIVLTLKDKDVLDEEEEDVLENIEIKDIERAEKNIENKLKKPTYNPYDEPEFDEFGIIKRKHILSKYDDEIEGEKKDCFQIGGSLSSLNREQELEAIQERLRLGPALTLEGQEHRVASEYYTHEEMKKFKKPKRIVKSIRKKSKISEHLTDLPILKASSSSDHGSRNHRTQIKQEKDPGEDVKPKFNSSMKESVRIKPLLDFRTPDSDEEDETLATGDFTDILIEEQEAEEELRASLEKARKLRSEQFKTDRISEVVANIKREPDEGERTLSRGGEKNIILDSTAEFCRNLGDISTIKTEEDDEEDMMDFEKELIEERKRRTDDMDISSGSGDEDSSGRQGKWNEVDVSNEKKVTSETADFADSVPILEEEPNVSRGVAGALKLAMKKGYLDRETKRPTGSTRVSMLQAQNYTIEEKFYEDDKIGRRERYNGPVMEFKEKDGYNPDVKLEYADEKGRLLNRKEAFRVLSHKFHGKGPGKNMIDKRTRKIEQDSKLKSMHSTDTPLGTLALLQQKQKELNTPYVVLSGASTSLVKK